MEITLIRHLPTIWNKQGILQGRRDIPILPITEAEHNTIQRNICLLQQHSFDQIFCSTLQRTIQTAHAYGFHPTIEVLLDEFNFGPFEGQTKEQLNQAYHEQWLYHPRDIVLGESGIQFENRLISFLHKYPQTARILIFGHGAWIRGLHSYINYGNINKMNEINIHNNECITLTFHPNGVKN